jgi:triosephosphate isomerase
MRKKIIVGNWKMNTNLELAYNLVIDINRLKGRELESIILVPFTHIKTLQEIARPNLHIGAQNVSQYECGAYTGEISASMLESLDIKYVTVGHSERRTIFNENDAIIAEKVKKALNYNLHPIVCCGESLEERKNGTYLNFVQEQIESALFDLKDSDIKNLTIAYEPIWAIGTGETASAPQAQEVHAFIRRMIEKKFGSKIAYNVTILYGGSVKPSNAKELFSEEDIDGALVGGASLDAKSFVEIIKSL